MNDSVQPDDAAKLVDDLERRVAPFAQSAPPLREDVATVADAPDGVATVPGAPEPPD
jgi:hypothetical protein